MKTNLVFILYDGIENSIFDGQVLQPLLNKQQKNIHLHITLISFETKKPSNKKIATINKLPNFKLIILKRYPFLGVSSLKLLIPQLKSILQNIAYFEIIARGPHAGWLAINTIHQRQCSSIIIQIRGLLANEYLYVHQQIKNPLKQCLYYWRAKQYEYLEQRLYNDAQEIFEIPVIFEAVSPALKEYLIKKYGLNPQKITIAQNDIPQPIDSNQQKKWRTAIRAQLGLSGNPHIYCYNGSVKQWQCPNNVVEFFAQKLQQRENCFLLILTQDKKQFEQLLKKHRIDPACFYVCTIRHEKVYEYLSACDTGLLFREKNIINWVSRPTKVLEYKAAGLTIIHNNTVAYLTSEQ
jgi:glycosyltransferase involved in cell wall biosynthesis